MDTPETKDVEVIPPAFGSDRIEDLTASRAWPSPSQHQLDDQIREDKRDEDAHENIVGHVEYLQQ